MYKVGDIIVVDNEVLSHEIVMDFIKAMQSRDTGIPKQVMVAMSCIQAAHEIVKDIKDVKKEAAIKSKHIDRAQWKNRQRYHNR
jgi:hypothetical protein